MSEINVAISDGPQPSVKIVTFTGEMDEASLEVVKNQIDSLLNDSSVKRVIFNLTGLDFINSKGIGYLVSVHTHLSKDQRELVMAGANEVVMDVISLVGLTTIVKYFNTLEAAIADSGGMAPMAAESVAAPVPAANTGMSTISMGAAPAMSEPVTPSVQESANPVMMPEPMPETPIQPQPPAAPMG